MLMLQKILETPWDSYAQPEGKASARVPEALRCVYAANDAKSAEAASSKLRWAVGNDHSGTYYPVLLGVLPFLDDLLRNCARWPRETVLGFLTDLFYSFEPEIGYGEVTTTDGRCISVERKFRAWVRNLRPLLSDMAQRQDVMSDAAQGLLKAIDEKSG